MDNTLRTVKDFIKEQKLIQRGDIVCALNSFGKDSSVLVHVLNRLKNDLRFKLICINVQYAKHIFSDRKEVERITDFWRNEGVDIRTVRIPDNVTDVNHGGEEPCSKCKRVRREFIKQEIDLYLKEHERITIATGHNLWDLMGYLHVVEVQTGFFSSKPKNEDYICEMLGRFLPKMELGNIRMVRPLLPIGDTEVQRYLFDNTQVERLTSTCKYRMERPKRKIAQLTSLLEEEGVLNVSYGGLIGYVQKMKVLDSYAPKIKKVPWDVFTV